jgi:branched-chain amino acid transport system substrate-binding protein
MCALTHGARAAAVIWASLSLLVPARGMFAAPELKIAVLGPISGPTFGASIRDGALLAVDEWNARGGVLGARITAVVEDSQCAPDPAVDAANKVIHVDRVHFIVGEVCSRASIPISEIANAARVIQISPASTHPNVTIDKNGATKPYIFRACFIDSFQGRVGAAFAYRRLGARKAFLIFDPGDDYTKGLSESFEASFQSLGGSTVGKETHTFIDNDFSAILTKVRAAKPDIVYLPEQYQIVNLVMRQAREKGITAPFLGGDGWDSRDLDLNAADGGYYTNHYDPSDSRAEVRSFLKAYGQKYTDSAGGARVPDAIAVLSYDATNLLLTGIQAAGTEDTDKVKHALESMAFHGVSGTITFDASHNPVKGAVIIHVKDGKKVVDSFISP